MDALLKELLVTIQDTKGFLANQLPDVAVQIIRYGFWLNLAELFISLLYILASVLFFLWVYKKIIKLGDSYDDGVWWLLASVFIFSIGFLLAICSFSTEVMELFKIIFAPKLYLIDYIRGAVSK